MSQARTYVGTAQSRVDGRLKVTGAARYAAEFNTPGLAHGVVISSDRQGPNQSIDASAALAVPGVVQVFTHDNRPRTSWFSRSTPGRRRSPGSPFRPLYDDKVVYSGQPIALVVAEDFGVANYAASLVRIEYEVETHRTDLNLVRNDAYVPSKKRLV